MTTPCPRSALLRAFGSALDADIAISPMIIVGGTDDALPWLDSLSDLSEACGMGRTVSYVADSAENAEDMADWVSSREDDDETVRAVAIVTQGLGDSSRLNDMLHHVKDRAWGEHVIVVVIDPEQLDDTRRDIRTILGVHQALVPISWQGVEPTRHEVQILAQIVGGGRSNGVYVIDAISTDPYPHEIELYLDMGEDDDANMDAIEKLGQADFAALAIVRGGSLVSTLADIETLSETP